MKIFDENPSVVRFVGDTHPVYTTFNQLVKCDYPVIQVGDFGQGFEPQEKYMDGNEIKYRHGPAPEMNDHVWFIRGNHDSPEVCKANPHWIPDGHIEHGVMFIGGAESIDVKERQENVDWWADEQLSQEDLENIVDIADREKPSIMVTHDCPSFLLNAVFYGMKPPSRTAQALNVIYNIVQPKLWVFGHYHRSIRFKAENTLFICCGIDEAVDIDIGGLIK
jgi:Icc-related predicted phosphoesterase